MYDSLQLDDTIAALASAPGPAERGIVRVSGGEVRGVLGAVFTPNDVTKWSAASRACRHPGVVHLPGVHLPVTVSVFLWPTTRSYTGQPLAEVHLIGSPPLLESLLTALFAEGVRPANRGEFTLRAFLAGRIDLLQAEAVLGVIDASDQQHLNRALGQLGGGMSNRIAELHEQLLLHLADLEAGLDFVEEDIEFINRDELQRRLDDGAAFLERLTAQSDARMQSTGRRRVVLAGLPNAGKSTLFNTLIGDDRAIVSHVAGTTRDYLSATIDCGGITVELIDTAGWDDDAAGIERSADQLRQEQWDRADLIVWCTADDVGDRERSADDSLFGQCSRNGKLAVRVFTKADQLGESDRLTKSNDRDWLAVSAVTGEGLDQLRSLISARLQSVGDSELLGSTVSRCRDSLRGAVNAMNDARAASVVGAGDELIAVDLRTAIDELGKIVGRVYTDDVLDRIFSRFCIGK